MLSASDAGRIGRLVLPKKCAEVSCQSDCHFFVCRFSMVTLSQGLMLLRWNIAFIAVTSFVCMLKKYLFLLGVPYQNVLLTYELKIQLC